MKYQVLDDNTVLAGTAENILQKIIKKNNGNEEISRMTVDEYADALIENADYYLPKTALKSLNTLKFETKYDKALRFLSTMPASGAVIISDEPEARKSRG